MATEEQVEITERVVIDPAEGEDDLTPEGEDPEEESPEGNEEPGGAREPKEQIVVRQPAPTAEESGLAADDLAEVEGETPRERALRLEVTRLKKISRQERTTEIIGQNAAPHQPQKGPTPEMAKILEKYKPEEIQSLREVLPYLAEEMGFVRNDQLNANNYTEKASGELDAFLEKHPEYLPQNDKDNVLWGRFTQEYGMYKQPTDPRDFRKIFDRIHRDIFGIKAAGETKPTVTAAQRKVTSASHAGASTPPRSTVSTRPQSNTSGLRLDMLKGFSDEEIAELES